MWSGKPPVVHRRVRSYTACAPQRIRCAGRIDESVLGWKKRMRQKDAEMARKRIDPTVGRAQEVQEWLESLELEPRVINALRRELEVVQGTREGIPGKRGALDGIDRARFVAELYREQGGMLRLVPSVGAHAIAALRLAIPAPARANGAHPLPDDDNFVLPPLDAAPPAADAAPPEAEAPTVAPAPPVAVPELAEAPPAPAKRRGRPPRAVAALQAPETEEAPAKRRGRPPRIVTAPKTPGALSKPMQQVSAAPALAPAPAAPAAELRAPQLAPAPAAPALAAPHATTVTDPSFVVLLQLWSELHPQGRRAAMHYMAALLGA